MKNIWTKSFYCLLTIGVWLMATAYTPLSASEISATHGCNCGNADNYESGSNYYFAETVVIEGTAGDTWTVNTDYTVGLLDASGASMTAPISFSETSPGTYQLEFWHVKASGYGIHVYSTSGEYLSINGVCFDHCNSSCDMADGLLINDCVSDDRFTFSLAPSGAGFSGTYNLSGAVTVSGISGTYTSPALLSIEGDYSVVITDANDLSCGTTVTFPSPACAELSMNPLNECDCEHEDNYELNGKYYFAETVLVVADANDTWTVDMNFTVGLYDDSGNLMTGNLAFTEVASGVYALDFWHKKDAGYGLHAYNSQGDYGSLNNYCGNTCSSVCSIDNDGLLIGECLPDERFTFSLNPSGAGFSGTYNLSGDVIAYGVTGTYTSPPALSNVGDINVTITDAADPTCKTTVYIPPPSCASQECSINDFNLVVNNCTPDGSRFTFTFEPTGPSFSGTYNLSGDISAWGVTGAYTSPPALTSVEYINVTVTDAADPTCSATLYVTPPVCECNISDAGLVVNDCLPDDRFTFTLNPSGAGFSGTYNLSGDVITYGVTGTYTSPPALSNVGDINVTITDAADPTCKMTVYIPPPACGSAEPFIAAEHGCDCDNSDNFKLNDVKYMSENVGIVSNAGDTWTVNLTFSVGVLDASGSALSGAVTFTETSPGLYEFPFWHRVGAGYGIHAYNSAGDYVSLNDVCLTPCTPGMRLNTHSTELAISEVYPNPTQGGIVNIVFDSEASDNTRIIVSDVFGQQKMAIPVTTNKGANFATLQSQELSIGTYFVAIERNGERSAPVRFIKMK